MALGDKFNKGSIKGRKMPEMQVCPVINKKMRSTRIGADLLTGPVTRIRQAGVQIAKRMREMSEMGGFASPWKHWTIRNFQTTYNNAATRSGDLTPDEVYELLMQHPARFDRTNPAGRFTLKLYVPELTAEERSLASVSNSTMMPASSQPAKAVPQVSTIDPIEEAIPVGAPEIHSGAPMEYAAQVEEEDVLV